MKPIIGITGDYVNTNISDNVSVFGSCGQVRLMEGYFRGVEESGGIPIVIPPIKSENIDSLLNRLDGIIFSGGTDIDPKFFKEDPIREMGNIIPVRDEFEIELARRAYNRDVPVLGICRGVQVINVAMGGSLYQDIYSQIREREVLKHSQLAEVWYGTHKVSIKANTRLMDIFEESSIYVNSFHHQAIKELGENLEISALSPDEIIEGIEGRNHRFFVGVQWHPERMWHKNEIFLKLFKALIVEAGK